MKVKGISVVNGVLDSILEINSDKYSSPISKILIKVGEYAKEDFSREYFFPNIILPDSLGNNVEYTAKRVVEGDEDLLICELKDKNLARIYKGWCDYKEFPFPDDLQFPITLINSEE